MILGRVLVFCPYYPPHMGGLESHAKEFNENISRYFDRVVVFTPNLPETIEGLTLESEIEVIRFPAVEIVPNFFVPKFWSKKFWKLYKSLGNEKFTIVISRTRFFLTSLMALFFSKRNGIRWVHIEHGSDFVKLSNSLTTFLARLYDEIFGRIVFKCSDINIPISNAVDKFIEKFDKRKRQVIYRGINIKEIDLIKKNPEIDRKYNNHFKFVFCGRLYKWKGVERSIRLFNSFSNRDNNKFIFFIIGDGEDFFKLKKFESKNIIFLGKKSREEAISIVKCADIFLHSSYPGGGLSTSLLEAMVCGCCPVATQNEGADEIIVDGVNGYIYNFDNIVGLKKNILKIISSNKVDVVGNNARKSIINKFHWENSINKYVLLFGNLLKDEHSI